MIVAERPYELSDPTVDSQVVALKASGADIMVTFSTPKAASQTIRKIAEIGWKPLHFLSSISNSVGSVIKPAGFDHAQGLMSNAYAKDPTDPTWRDDPAAKEWLAFMDKYFPEGDKTNSNNVYGYTAAQTLVQVLRRCGDDLTRANIMKQAANLRDLELGMLLPGIKINTDASDFFPIEQVQMMRFDGESWKLFGEIITGEVGSEQSR